MDSNLICDACRRCYKNKNTLRKHLKKCYFGLDPLVGVFKCDVCKADFRYKSSMLRHKRRLHMEDANIWRKNNVSDSEFICDICRRYYSNKNSLRKHMKKCYFGQNTSVGLFKCDVCNAEFKYRSSMLRHKHSIHLEIPINLEEDIVPILKYSCEFCNRSYSRKDIMLRHINKCYFGNTEICRFQCDTCKQKFARKDLLEYHCSRHLLIGSNVNCAECASFPTMLNIVNRILAEYDVELNHVHYEFATEDDFWKWKENLEKSTVTFYRKKNVDKFKQYSTHRFICHRSGTYISKSHGKRELKFYGSKKVGKCPALIRVYKDNETGWCKVLHIDTHLGHNINNKKDELRHIYHNKEDYLSIGSKIMLDVPSNTIFPSNADSTSINSNVDNVYILHNDADIKSSVIVSECSDTISVAEPFILKYSNSIIYHKKQNELDVKFPELMMEDIVIVMMSNSQKEYLQKYGQNIIIVDGTNGITADKQFLMHTIFVVDDDNKEIEVAFAVSNRNDELLVFILFCCIRDVIGIIFTRTLMTDIHESYYSNWKNIMSEPVVRLFCLWHVREDWQKNLKQIPNAEKRKSVRNQLYKILSRLDESTFQAELNEFLSGDTDLEKFMTYFNTYYVKNVEAWPYCYRKGAYKYTNMCTETFYSVLKKSIRKTNNQKISFNFCLELLDKYLQLKEREVLKKEIQGKIPSKLKTLRRYHKSFEQSNKVINISGSHSEGWYVFLSSGTDNANVYFIYPTRENCLECRLYCSKCEACIHQFACSCIDNSIRYNMCIHIHALCTFLVNNNLKIRNESNYQEIYECFPLESLEEIATQPRKQGGSPLKLVAVLPVQSMEGTTESLQEIILETPEEIFDEKTKL